jgi:thiamine biosynthesis lipoprotein
VGVALRAAEQTDGAVDPTVAPALVALGYDRDFAAIDANAADHVRGVPAAGGATWPWTPGAACCA